MKFIDRLLYKCRRFSIDNLMIYIVATMFAIFALEFIFRIDVSSWLTFNSGLIMKGQIWRLITFIFIPPGSSNAVFLLLSLYFYYFIGSQLENVWGSSQFTIYYLFGIIGAIAAGFISGSTSNVYLNLSLFFAFAHMFPDHQVLLFFLLPIKIKYLAYINWFFFLASFVWGGMTERIAIVLSLVNFFLFFGPDIFSNIKRNIKSQKRRKEFNKQMRGGGGDIWR